MRLAKEAADQPCHVMVWISTSDSVSFVLQICAVRAGVYVSHSNAHIGVPTPMNGASTHKLRRQDGTGCLIRELRHHWQIMGLVPLVEMVLKCAWSPWYE